MKGKESERENPPGSANVAAKRTAVANEAVVLAERLYEVIQAAERANRKASQPGMNFLDSDLTDSLAKHVTGAEMQSFLTITLAELITWATEARRNILALISR